MLTLDIIVGPKEYSASTYFIALLRAVLPIAAGRSGDSDRLCYGSSA